MANLFDQKNNDDKEGFNPRVDNSSKSPKHSIVVKVLFWILGLVIFSAIYFIKQKNRFLKQQVLINESASTIDTQLAKRSSTLIKLADQIKSYKKHEGETFSEVAKLRSLSSGSESFSERESLNSSLFSKINFISENYPELKASELYATMMNETIYIEREISAARRLYNSYATEFNIEILKFPKSIISSGLKLSTAPLFKASEKQTEDPAIEI